eukprot:TRINITY_DN7027_c0_g1_i2.p1 TRINITY_DN7027_c0_g1~~TRINITY_DN7027_c0_g1_i2.p1  ORF type:complete len:283 (-),score=72.61 TRINITY_DN7027_c0_g1_i2:37-885(-)
MNRGNTNKHTNDGIQSIRILVLGDSGTGKTSLVHLLCHDTHIIKPHLTVGANLDSKIFEYNDKSYSIEFVDVGGSGRYELSRNTFYSGINGIMLVYDLTNRNSFLNLKKWIAEYISYNSGADVTGKLKETNESPSFWSELFRSKKNPSNSNITEDMLELELSGGVVLPLMIVGNKEDKQEEKKKVHTFGQESGSNIIHVSSHSNASFAAGSEAYYSFSSFIMKVINRKFASQSYTSNTSVPQKGSGLPTKTFVPAYTLSSERVSQGRGRSSSYKEEVIDKYD